jgi:hypothetical protein
MEGSHWYQKVVSANADLLTAHELKLLSFRTDSLIQILILYSIHTGLLTSIVHILAGVLVSHYSPHHCHYLTISSLSFLLNH